MSDTLLCPNCGCVIEVSTTLSAQLREHLRRELETKLAHEALTKAKEAVTLEFGDLHDQLTETRKKLVAAQQAELKLRKDRRELEAQTEELELSVNRRLDEERQALRAKAKTEADDENRLRDAEREKVVNDLRKQIDELKRKSEQSMPQAQGEIMELELEQILRSQFPADTLEPIPVGAHGGDVLQHVYDGAGQACGSILWEFKRTKAWSDNWLPKLREDQRAAKAHLAVLASAELPKTIKNFGRLDDVWVTNRACLVGVATALRAGLLEVGRVKSTLAGKQTKMDQLSNYLAGPEFNQRVDGVLEVFATMKDDLDSEKRSLERLWAKRLKLLERGLLNATSLQGDVEGILGDALPPIADAELVTIACANHVDDPDQAPW